MTVPLAVFSENQSIKNLKHDRFEMHMIHLTLKIESDTGLSLQEIGEDDISLDNIFSTF
jgi:hypothetical protein